MGLYDKFKTSSKTEKDGITLDYGFARIRVARAGGANQRFNAAMAKIAREHKRAIDHDLLSDDRVRKILYETFASTVILGWETRTSDDGIEPATYVDGIEGQDGDILPVTDENIVKTFNNLPDLFLSIREDASNLSYFRQSLIEDAGKN